MPHLRSKVLTGAEMLQIYLWCLKGISIEGLRDTTECCQKAHRSSFQWVQLGFRRSKRKTMDQNTLEFKCWASNQKGSRCSLDSVKLTLTHSKGPNGTEKGSLKNRGAQKGYLWLTGDQHRNCTGLIGSKRKTQPGKSIGLKRTYLRSKWAMANWANMKIDLWDLKEDIHRRIEGS